MLVELTPNALLDVADARIAKVLVKSNPGRRKILLKTKQNKKKNLFRASDSGSRFVLLEPYLVITSYNHI